MLVAVSLDELTLGLAEALAASGLLEKAHLIRRVIHLLCRGHNLTLSPPTSLDIPQRCKLFPSTLSAFSYQPPTLFVMASQWSGFAAYGYGESAGAHANPLKR